MHNNAPSKYDIVVTTVPLAMIRRTAKERKKLKMHVMIFSNLAAYYFHNFVHCIHAWLAWQYRLAAH